MPDKSKDKYEKIFQWQNLSSMNAILRRNQGLILASEIFRPLDMVYALRLAPTLPILGIKYKINNAFAKKFLIHIISGEWSDLV